MKLKNKGTGICHNCTVNINTRTIYMKSWTTSLRNQGNKIQGRTSRGGLGHYFYSIFNSFSPQHILSLFEKRKVAMCNIWVGDVICSGDSKAIISSLTISSPETAQLEPCWYQKGLAVVPDHHPYFIHNSAIEAVTALPSFPRPVVL